MADFDPDAYLAEKKAEADDFDPDAYLAGPLPEGVAPESPLAKALAAQSGPVVTAETPTGPAQFTREGQRVLSEEERQQRNALGDAGFKQHMLGGLTSLMGGTTGGGFADEALGAYRAGPGGVAKYLAGKLNPMAAQSGNAYRRERDAVRRDVDQAIKDYGPRAGGVPVLPVLGSFLSAGPVPTSPAAVVAGGGLVSTLSAAGQSNAELGSPEFSEDVEDATKTGLFLSAASGAATGALGPLSRRIASEEQAARGALVDAKMATLEKAKNAARGALGGETSAGFRTLEHARTVLANPQDYLPEVVTKAKAFMDSAEAQALLQRTAMAAIDRGHGQAGRIASAQQGFADASARAVPAVAQSLADETMAGLGSDFAGRLWRSVGQRGALTVGGGLAGGLASEALGGDWKTGTGLGGLAGWATPGTLQMFRNVAKNPAYQAKALEMAGGALGAGQGVMRGAAHTAQPAGSATRDERERVAIEAFLNGG